TWRVDALSSSSPQSICLLIGTRTDYDTTETRIHPSNLWFYKTGDWSSLGLSLDSHLPSNPQRFRDRIVHVNKSQPPVLPMFGVIEPHPSSTTWHGGGGGASKPRQRPAGGRRRARVQRPPAPRSGCCSSRRHRRSPCCPV